MGGGRKAIIIFVPVPQLKSFQKIQVRLVRELEKKFSGKHVVFIAQVPASRSGRSRRRGRSRARPTLRGRVGSSRPRWPSTLGPLPWRRRRRPVPGEAGGGLGGRGHGRAGGGAGLAFPPAGPRGGGGPAGEPRRACGASGVSAGERRGSLRLPQFRSLEPQVLKAVPRKDCSGCRAFRGFTCTQPGGPLAFKALGRFVFRHLRALLRQCYRMTVSVLQRRILPKPTRKSRTKNKQKRPRR